MNYLEHLHSLDNELKNKFRKLESIHLKIINTKWSHTFNEVCLKENILPNYVNLWLNEKFPKSRNREKVQLCLFTS